MSTTLSKDSAVVPIQPESVVRMRLATEEERSDLCDMFYCVQREGRLFWDAVKEEEEEEEEEEEGEEDEDKDVIDYASTPRVAKRDDVLEYFETLAETPVAERSSELCKDHERYANFAVLSEHRVGSKGPRVDAERISLKAAFQDASAVMAAVYVDGQSMEMLSRTSTFQELSKRMKKVGATMVQNLPPSISIGLGLLSGGPDIYSPIQHQPKRQKKGSGASASTEKPSTVKPSGRGRGGSHNPWGRSGKPKGAIEPTIEKAGTRVVATASETLAEEVRPHTSHRRNGIPLLSELLSDRPGIDSRLPQRAAWARQEEDLLSQLSAKGQELDKTKLELSKLRTRYEKDHNAWKEKFILQQERLSNAQGSLQDFGHSTAAKRAQAVLAPFKLDSRPFNQGSASASRASFMAEDQGTEPEFVFAQQLGGAGGSREAASLFR